VAECGGQSVERTLPFAAAVAVSVCDSVPIPVHVSVPISVTVFFPNLVSKCHASNVGHWQNVDFNVAVA